MNDMISAEVDVGWRHYSIEQLTATRDVEAFPSKADKLRPLRGGYEVQDEDGNFYLGRQVVASRRDKVVVQVNSNFTVTRMFADLSDTEREIILDHNVRIVNLEAAEQPEVFDLTPDEDSDRDEADEVFIDRYLITKSPVKWTGKP